MENLAIQDAYDSNFYFENLRHAGLGFNVQSVIAGLEQLMIASSKPYCSACCCETEILFTGGGKVCDICLSPELLRITPRGRIANTENLLMLVLSYDCPIERYKAQISPAEQNEMIEDGTLLKIFGICYRTDELQDWLGSVNTSFNHFPYSLAG